MISGAPGSVLLPAQGSPTRLCGLGPPHVASLLAALPGSPCFLNRLPKMRTQSCHFPVSSISGLRMKRKPRNEVTCPLGSHSQSFPGFHTPLTPATRNCSKLLQQQRLLRRPFSLTPTQACTYPPPNLSSTLTPPGRLPRPPQTALGAPVQAPQPPRVPLSLHLTHSVEVAFYYSGQT